MKPDEQDLPDHAWDLPVYRHMLDACFQVLSTVIPMLPDEADGHLVRGLSRSCQRIPDLIALGVATWRTPHRFPYLDMAGRECQDMIERLCHCQQAYGDHLELPMCNRLVEQYREAVKQLRTITARPVVPPPPSTSSNPSPAARRPQARMTLGMGITS